MFASRCLIVAICLLPAAWAAPAWAANEGQADLDSAIEQKLDADSPDDLGEVIRLCDLALSKGLDEENTAFAYKLLSSTLYQRANVLAEALLFNATRADPRLQLVYRQCLGDAERAVSIDPELAEAQLLLGRLHSFPGGNAVKAGKALDEAIRLANDNPELKADALTAMSNLRADPEARLDDLNEAIRLAPNRPQAYRLRARIRLQAQQAEEALKDLDTAIELDPDHAATHEARGLALSLLERLDEAKESFSRAVELAPESAMLLLRRAQVNLLSGEIEAAEADLSKVLEQQADEPRALLMRCEARLKLDRKEEALADVERVLELHPSEPTALRMHALVMAALERIDAAIADLEAVRRQLPRDPENIFRLGMLYSTQKRVPEAINAFSAVLALAPDNPSALRARANAYLSIGQQREAIADYEQALKQDADSDEVLNNLAWVLATSPDETLRDGKRSIELGLKACELTEYKAPHILSTLAAGYAETGDFESAIKWSSKAVELGGEELRGDLQKELDSYKAGKPWRELQSLDGDIEGEATRPKADENPSPQQ